MRGQRKNPRKAVQPFENKKRKIDIFKNYEDKGFEKIQRKLEIFSTLISKKSIRLKSIFRFEGEIQQKNRTESRFQRGVCQKVVRARLESACHCGKTRRTEASGQNILNVLPGGHRLSGYLSFY